MVFSSLLARQSFPIPHLTGIFRLDSCQRGFFCDFCDSLPAPKVCKSFSGPNSAFLLAQGAFRCFQALFPLDAEPRGIFRRQTNLCNLLQSCTRSPSLSPVKPFVGIIANCVLTEP